MITCKEDLRNTQASGDLVVPFQELAFKLGIGWGPNGNDMVVRENYGVIVCRDFGYGLELAHRHNLKEGSKRLTLSDLKPTKQYAVLHKGGSYSFQSDKPIGDDVVACFDLVHSEKPLSEDFFDENRQDDKQMKTYNTYQEAKIANPECDIYVHVYKNGFIPELEPIPTVDHVKCNPADYCMAVEEFLNSGRRLDVGDLFIDCFGQVVEVKGENVDTVNTPHEYDNNRHILRAAALEKPRTKVEYVKVEDESDWHVWEFLKAYGEADDERWFYKAGEEKYAPVIEWFDVAQGLRHGKVFYRRIEIPVTEREAFIDEAIDITGANENSNAHHAFALLFDSGKFKLVN